jgi:hypothetical protein
MIRQHPASILTGAEYVPYVVLRRSPSELAAELGITFEESTDDLDHYEIAALRLHDGPPFGLMRYRGHPPDEVRLLLAHDPNNIDRTHEALERILAVLALPDQAIAWRRKPSPLP